MTTYIIGHQKPDLDAVVSTLSLKYLFDNVDCFPQKETVPVMADPANNETQAIFKKFGGQLPKLLKPATIKPADKFVLVDHNEKTQWLAGIKEEQIVEIYDHHKVHLDLPMPIFINIKAWGATNTIVYYFMKTCNLKPNKQLASLMLSAILSDTVGLKSATTTDKDKQVVDQLAQIAGITNLDRLTLEIFKAKSNLANLTPQQIVKNDYKLFNFGGKKVLIDQVETVEQEKVLSQKEPLLEAMEQVKQKEKVDHIFVAISDILKVNTKLIYLSQKDQQVAEKAFSGRGKGNVLDIGPQLSRKKEIAPAIEKVLI